MQRSKSQYNLNKKTSQIISTFDWRALTIGFRQRFGSPLNYKLWPNWDYKNLDSFVHQSKGSRLRLQHEWIKSQQNNSKPIWIDYNNLGTFGISINQGPRLNTIFIPSTWTNQLWPWIGVRQLGQLWLVISQGLIQPEWNAWSHNGRTWHNSPSLKSSRQMAQPVHGLTVPSQVLYFTTGGRSLKICLVFLSSRALNTRSNHSNLRRYPAYSLQARRKHEIRTWMRRMMPPMNTRSTNAAAACWAIWEKVLKKFLGRVGPGEVAGGGDWGIMT